MLGKVYRLLDHFHHFQDLLLFPTPPDDLDSHSEVVHLNDIVSGVGTAVEPLLQNPTFRGLLQIAVRHSVNVLVYSSDGKDANCSLADVPDNCRDAGFSSASAHGVI
jgi:hypothetical protein